MRRRGPGAGASAAPRSPPASPKMLAFPDRGIDMKCLSEKITPTELQAMAEATFGNLVKAVIDIDKRIMVVDAELHSDQESFLLERGSRQSDLWGINLYPEFPKEDENFIEFDSMINLRPLDGNRSRSVEDPEIRGRIAAIVKEWIA